MHDEGSGLGSAAQPPGRIRGARRDHRVLIAKSQHAIGNGREGVAVGHEQHAPASSHFLQHQGDAGPGFRIEVGLRLVQHEKRSPRRECSDERDLLPVAGGIGPGPLVELEIESVDQFFAVGRIDTRAHAAEELKEVLA